MGDRARDLPLVIAHEGGATVTNWSWDPGGLTKYGLSKRANPDLDIANLTLDQAEAVYTERYWTPAGCDVLPEPLALGLFDAAVNLGVKSARALLVAPALALERIAENYLWARLERYRAITAANVRKATTEDAKAKEYAKFYGWVSRCLTLRRESVAP